MDSRAIIQVVDNLTSTDATAALSANQGRVLKELIDSNEAGDILNYSNLNTLTDKVYVGYGHNLTNAAYGSAGYVISIPNLNNSSLYVRQFFTHYQNNIIYTRSLNNGVWLDWSPVTNLDSGWLDVTLSGDVQAYSSGTQPQYRKIGNVVYLRGAVKNITSAYTTIGVLPSGYRPTSIAHQYIQVTSNENDSPNFSRMKVGTDGAIIMEGISTGITATYNDTDWYPVNTSFIVD